MKKDDCIFCKIAAGEIGSCTVYEDDNFRAFLDLGPAAKGHTLVVPKNHSDDLLTADDETLRNAAQVIAKVANGIKSALNCDGINLVQNNGEAAGQTVKHLHFHLIPRYNNDGVNLLWTPGSAAKEELEEVGKIISEHIK